MICSQPLRHVIRSRSVIVLALAAATLAVYAQTLDFDFVHFDDHSYVVKNPMVERGLDAESVRWAFTASHLSNWHPLTWLSYMLDTELLGSSARGFHATNVALHVLNVLLFFFVLESLTAHRGASALAAALFALHPLHVESVAWISERKDVLSSAFGLLAIASYAAYARRGGALRYALVPLCLALSLMAKPMWVTLPVALLLLDYWPLRRFGGAPAPRGAAALAPRCATAAVRRLVLEKLPLLLLSAASGALALAAQSRAMGHAAEVSLWLRAANAAVSCVRYLHMALWPTGLSAHYPHPNLPGGVPWSALEIAGAGALLLVLTLLAAAARRRPQLLVGWLWFLGTLVPVLGFVQVGTQAMADRYTYVPLIGLYVAFAWSCADAVRACRRRSRRAAVALVAAIVLLVAAAGGRAANQAGMWRDSVTLYRRSLEVEPRSALFHANLGNRLLALGDRAGAHQHYEEALRLQPDSLRVQAGLAWLLATSDDPALRDPERALALAGAVSQRLRHRDVNALDTLGAAFAATGDFPRAIAAAERAIELARRRQNERLAEEIALHLARYRAGEPWISPPPE